ncbi:flagellar biosynthesis protein FlhF [Ideonella sp. 4Y11]|uniref:Flagellar biosynthesis protein FlhF n=1 Tax=Ideonella aquatica TaxID=2824119 RepID=A0A941BKD7_9BURK|nr:flagellar biosynthesis protein FlhF [Ideonella aquatica]MBQ0958469.1 flagellar biosynthesis protein FlhF [Ideonella aquatica]
MNVKRFTARTSREAFVLVRQAFGEDAVVLSTKPCSEGVEVLAMAPDAVDQIERVSGAAARKPAPARDGLAARAERQTAQRGLPGQRLVERQPGAAITQNEVDQDVEQLQMSTLSFQDYVRERMLRRRQAAIDGTPTDEATEPMPAPAPAQRAASASIAARASSPTRSETAAPIVVPQLSEALPERRDQVDMVHELRAMKGLIEERFGALAFMEKLQRHPQQATLAQTLLDCGWSPGLIRKMVEALPAQTADAPDWAARVLERNLATSEAEPALEEQGGIYALIGSTGVGKTTSTAKLAAAFATRYGASNLGLITLDAYRVGAQEQLRTYGRILGVPVHTAHDRASLEDLLELLAGKRMVLIDTAGIAQRDSRTKELLEMLSHPSIQRLLVVDASSQGETIDEVITAWRAARCKGVVLSKIDEAVKLAPALDAVIRHRLKVLAVANGQRVPEDWHRLSSNALVQRAMKATGAASWRLELPEVQLVFATAPRVAPAPSTL